VTSSILATAALAVGTGLALSATRRRPLSPRREIAAGILLLLGLGLIGTGLQLFR
jgi:hypothetical protein